MPFFKNCRQNILGLRFRDVEQSYPANFNYDNRIEIAPLQKSGHSFIGDREPSYLISAHGDKDT
jgi:hypothetical protein